MKVRYFYQIDRQRKRPLVLWGAGRNGKDLAKLLLEEENHLHWVCDNPRKIGKEIYGITIRHQEDIQLLDHPQILIVVTAPEEKAEIRTLLAQWGKKPIEDFWFFA
jgi:FlaA1/EpsC-like NDP-sugar epimerase